MKRNPAMLAKPWKDGNPKGWWVSEKYDGLRAIWTGTEFVSRNDKPFYAPKWFTKDLPPFRLDGELWIGRGVANFQEAVSIVRGHNSGQRWKQIRYMVFDLPDSKETFEVVQRKLNNWYKLDRPQYAEIVPQDKVTGQADLNKRMKAMLAVGGEGLMLREAGSRYVPKRSSALQKVKPSYDAEAKVTGYQAGTGKHKGRMGAILVHLLSDKSKRFKIGTGFSDREREDPPAIGDVVEFGYSDLTRDGIPRHPRFHRVRTDMMPRESKKTTKPKATSDHYFSMGSKDLVRDGNPKGKRVLFSGSRHWDQVAPVRAVISSIPRESTIIHGGAKGLDSLAGALAKAKGLKVEVYEADWSRGRGAGPERNQEMVDAGADIVYAFPVEGSRGTWDLVKRARKAGLTVQVYGEDFGTTERKTTKPKTTKPKTTKPKTTKPKATKPKATSDHYFSMGSKDLVRDGSAGAKKELKRRGRDSSGKKLR